MDSFPGTYALVLQTAQASNVRVGRLGEMPVQPGFYVYVGSAFGPGGLRGRLLHHLKRQAAPHWHIDYLRRVTDLLEVWMAAGPAKREHKWAQILCLSPGASIPLPRFGASDCRCPAHLVYFADRPEESHLCQLLGGARLDVDILPVW